MELHNYGFGPVWHCIQLILRFNSWAILMYLVFSRMPSLNHAESEMFSTSHRPCNSILIQQGIVTSQRMVHFDQGMDFKPWQNIACTNANYLMVKPARNPTAWIEWPLRITLITSKSTSVPVVIAFFGGKLTNTFVYNNRVISIVYDVTMDGHYGTIRTIFCLSEAAVSTKWQQRRYVMDKISQTQWRSNCATQSSLQPILSSLFDRIIHLQKVREYFKH